MAFDSKRIFRYNCSICGEEFKTTDKHADACPSCSDDKDYQEPIKIPKSAKRSRKNDDWAIDFE